MIKSRQWISAILVELRNTIQVEDCSRKNDFVPHLHFKELKSIMDKESYFLYREAGFVICKTTLFFHEESKY